MGKEGSRQGDQSHLSSPDQYLQEELGKATSVLKSDYAPEEEAIQSALKICRNLANALGRRSMPQDATASTSSRNATSGLSSLDEATGEPFQSSPTKLPSSSILMKQKNAALISSVVDMIITDPKVFITPTLLSTYVSIQLTLSLPQSLPRVFELYAVKPIPLPGTSPIVYKKSNPDRPSCAIPLVLAESALRAAIGQKDLNLCLRTIETTVSTQAFRRSKVVRKALLPAAGLALAPAAAYVLASQLALNQHSMDVQNATRIFFAGIVAYVGFTAIIGIVAITTSNDQMDRITWARGTPLRDRWLREDERTMVDQVAGAWGFKETFKRGEEDSDDWEALREWAGLKGFILDNPELMEGME